MEGQQIITCTKCGSNKVTENKIIRNIFIGALLLCFIPIVGWIAVPFVFATGIAGLIIKKAKKIELMKCMECKQALQAGKGKYEEYKAFLNSKVV